MALFKAILASLARLVTKFQITFHPQTVIEPSYALLIIKCFSITSSYFRTYSVLRILKYYSVPLNIYLYLIYFISSYLLYF